MSEPYSAFLKLQISRENLARWLAAPVPAASRWSDWRTIGGQWYLTGGKDLAACSDQDLGKLVSECDAMLARHSDNRAALRAIMQSAEADNIKVAAYDSSETHFVAGSLTYSENLYDLVVFLTVARGAADFFEPEGRGLAVVHDYIWGEEGERETVAALGLAGKGGSGFLASDEFGHAAGAFERMVDAMLEGKDDTEFHPRDQLDRL
ncbi:hypothetical protein AXY46_04740 [Achromobacter xylosoxidans]|uniref:hypothetical protein n=1 Tax=Achromobacter mucicolens TaxID=1389922 RepID=UPI0007962D39|nr:hypothetical protein [Achromobacter mucicolens]KXJ62709.1 hypothetical protein AXY46_04740 [Achromobacter xylosoxidans]MDH1521255.1 hypothetical protein [Achromobacter mucicolens]UAN04983.1 hypothetical protein K9D24_13045 [Achromobacter mucicolens]